jgi:glycosyltransferase involved in cell wall biosynthesis
MSGLRVGVPPALAAYPPGSSPERMWGHVLGQLQEHVDLRLVDPRRGRWRRRAVDVWLSDGHQGPLPVPEPVVAHLHEASWADPALRPLFEPGFLTAYEQPSAAAAAAAARIVTPSRSSKAQVVAAYGRAADDVHVVHHGVDHAVYHPGVGAAGPVLHAAGANPNRPYVLFVSVLHPRKNLAALRDAMALLAAEGDGHALVLVAGPAADRADSAALAAEATAPIPGVRTPVANLAGASDAEVARLMAGAEALCLPSLMEGFGMAVAEAMACGAPPVVSDRGSLPEVVGDAGVVVSPTAEGVAAGLEAVLGDRDGRAERRGRAVARAAAFTWPAAGRGFLDALERAAAG